MTTVSDHQIKVNRALSLSQVGKYPSSASAMLRAVPDSVLAKVTSRELADLLDAMWDLSAASKAIADAETISEGGVWDNKELRFRALI